MAADPAETAFLASAAARVDDLLGGLSGLASAAGLRSQAEALALGLGGVLLLVAGARWRRPMGVVGGAALGALGALAASGWLQVRWPGLPRPAMAAAGAAALALLGGLEPRLFVFAAGALPGAVLGVAVPIAERPWLGQVAGAAALGVLALWASELTAVAVASLLGAGLLGGALLAAAGPRPEAAALVARPFLLLGWLAVVGAAGGAAQLGRSFGQGRAAGGRGPGGAPPLSPPDRPEGRGARSPGSWT